MPNNDAMKPPRKTDAPASPGPLRGRATLAIQTRHAQRLINGRLPTEDKAFIPGLFHFAGAAGRIWQAAALDDPWADWFLLRLEDGLKTARQEVGCYREQVTDKLSQSATTLEVAHSVHPIEVPSSTGSGGTIPRVVGRRDRCFSWLKRFVFAANYLSAKKSVPNNYQTYTLFA